MSLTPGLKITESTIVRRSRILPLQGEVIVNKGERVNSDTIVARANAPGDFQFVNVAQIIGIEPRNIGRFLLKKAGDKVEKEEAIAEFKMLFGLLKTTCRSPSQGTITNISTSTGRIIIQEPPNPVLIKAYIPGEVTHVFPGEGAIIETAAAFAQGIFGIGGETQGEILVVSESPDEVLSEEQLGSECKKKVVVGGSLATVEALKKASDYGATGVIVGGIEDEDLIKFLGYDIGVAITGQENINTTIIMTEGFGKIKMAERMFNLLKRFEGHQACICGATQIRAGVIRPEIIIPREDIKLLELKKEPSSALTGLEIGTHIRIIRKPYFGALAYVTRLPEELQLVETGSTVRVLEAELEEGGKAIVPRSNVEIIG